MLDHETNALLKPAWPALSIEELTAAPEKFLPLAMLIFVLMLALYRSWTKPLVAGTLFVLFLVFYFGSTALDSNFRSIVMKPDNLNERNLEFEQAPLKQPVFLNSVPKCGTHLIRNVMRMRRARCARIFLSAERCEVVTG